MKIKIESLKRSLFYLSYFILFFNTMCNKIKYVEPYMSIISKIGLGIVLMNFILSIKKVPKDKLLLLFLVLVISVVTYIIIDDSTILLLLLFLINTMNYKVEDIIKFDFFIRILVSIFVIINSYLGYTNDLLFNDHGTIRTGLGFSHPNLLGFNMLIIYIEYIYLKNMKFKIYNIFIFAILLFIIFKYSGSRSSIYFMIIVLIVQLFHNILYRLIEKSSFIKSLIKNLFLVLLFITIFFTFLYKFDIGKEINKILSNRLYYNNVIVKDYDIKLFGQNLALVSNEQARTEHIDPLILDNSYLTIIYKYGILTFIIFYILFRKTFITLIKKEKYSEIVILCIFIIYGFMENYMFRVIYNPFLFFFLYVLNNNLSLEEEYEKH